MSVHFRLAMVAAALVLSAACSKTEEPKKRAATPPPAPPQAAPAQPPAAPAAAAAPAAKPLAEADFQANGVKVALLELKRTSTGINARWQYRNESDSEASAAIGASVGSDPWRAANTSYLLDGATRTKYSVAKDSDGKLVAAQHNEFVHSIKLRPRAVINTWAKFDAPPETTKRVTVVIGGAPPFEDVPIE